MSEQPVFIRVDLTEIPPGPAFWMLATVAETDFSGLAENEEAVCRSVGIEIDSGGCLGVVYNSENDARRVARKLADQRPGLMLYLVGPNMEITALQD